MTVLRVMKEIAEVATDFPVPQVQKHVVEVFKKIRQERVSERTVAACC